jgi:DNA-binding PadR family transcriptional regulator
MSLRHGLLGLLAEGPASGYDLAGRFQEVLGMVWPAQHPKIYAELNRLADEGYIEVESVGARGRKAYRITQQGRDEVRRWLNDTDVDHTMRLQALLRSAFFWLMSPDEIRRHLSQEANYYREAAAFYRTIADGKDRGEFGDGPPVRSLRIAAEAGIRLHEALADWAEWAQSTPLASDEDAAADTQAK